MIIDVIHISTKSLTECVSREVVNFDMILLLELFEPHVDPLNSHRLVAGIGWHYIVILIRAPK